MSIIDMQVGLVRGWTLCGPLVTTRRASADDEADGDVPDGVAIVRVDGVSLVAPSTSEADHKIREVDLARFIGMEPRFLRRRVKEYENKGDLNGVDWRASHARQSTGNGGVRVFKVDSAFLTMDQALFIVAKSDSPSANALTRQAVRPVPPSLGPPAAALTRSWWPVLPVASWNRKGLVSVRRTATPHRSVADVRSSQERTSRPFKYSGFRVRSVWSASRSAPRIAAVVGCAASVRRDHHPGP